MAGEEKAISEFKAGLYHPAFPEHWRRASLYSLAKWVNGLTFREIQFSANGKPIIKIAEIKDGISSQTKFTEQLFDDAVHVKQGDLLFSWSGQPETSIDAFWWRGVDGWLNQHVFRVSSSSEIEQNFFFYLLRYLKPNFVGIARNKQTTGLGHVTKRDLENIEAAYPKDREEQRAIAHILGSLDDKIELNCRMNETLEAIARAMFKSWFVDFDPVRAKMRGEPPESICQRLGLTPDLLALFPDHLVDSELGEIPEGWTVMPLESLSEKISKGTTPTKQDITSATDAPSIRFIKVKDINEIGEIARNGLELIPASVHQGALKRSRLKTGDILFSIAGTIGRVAVVEADLNGSNTNQAVAFIRLKNRASHFGLCLQHLVSERIKDAANASVVQGVQANVSLASLGAFKILVPDAGVLELWNKSFDKAFSKKNICAAESRSLTEIRDALLPKLLSGELRVPESGGA